MGRSPPPFRVCEGSTPLRETVRETGSRHATDRNSAALSAASRAFADVIGGSGRATWFLISPRQCRLRLFQYVSSGCCLVPSRPGLFTVSNGQGDVDSAGSRYLIAPAPRLPARSLPQRPLDPAEGNPLLLQADALAQAIVAQVVVEGAFGGGQTGKFAIVGVALPNPKRRMPQQRLPIHQKRLRAREQRPQAVQDVEAVRVDVAPVVQRAAVEPAHFGETVEAVAQTENDQAAG